MKNYIIIYYSPQGTLEFNITEGTGIPSVKKELVNKGLMPVVVIPNFIKNLLNPKKNAGLSLSQCSKFFYELGQLLESTGSFSKTLMFLKDRSHKKESIFTSKKGFFKENFYKIIEFYYKDKFRKRNKLIDTLLTDINNGETPLKAFKYFEFDEVVISLIQVGQLTGDLPSNFKKISNYFETKKENKNSFTKTLLYPSFLFLLLFISFVIFLFYVMPQFDKFFNQFPYVPTKTKDTLNFFLDIKKYFLFYVFIVFGGILSFAYLWFTNYKDIKFKLYNHLLVLPIAGPLFRFSYLRWYFYQLSVLISSGITINTIMDYFRRSAQNSYFKNKFDSIYVYLLNGYSFSESFLLEEILPPEDLDSIRYAEVSGNLDDTTMKLSEKYKETTNFQINILTKTIYGISIFLIVLFILIMFFLIYMPLVSGIISLQARY